MYKRRSNIKEPRQLKLRRIKVGGDSDDKLLEDSDIDEEHSPEKDAISESNTSEQSLQSCQYLTNTNFSETMNRLYITFSYTHYSSCKFDVARHSKYDYNSGDDDDNNLPPDRISVLFGSN
ncbi:hypothetical protein FQA39_LY19086 [Lamprigera yunnana]|nr:hypothetical protein FQA39_LY19086 [Lamprigera yunnana]